jgi:polyhydroxyalkanoate synthesis repressor PhaR
MIRVIKRYESRKLYDTEESRYISLDDVAGWVRDDQDIQVIDNSTSDDVTAQILTQIIHEEGKRGTTFLPTDLLHDLVRGGERIVSSGVERVQGRVDQLVRNSVDRLGPVRRAREEMSQLREQLTELEHTLETLETETEAQVESEGKAPPRPARKPKAKKAATVH